MCLKTNKLGARQIAIGERFYTYRTEAQFLITAHLASNGRVQRERFTMMSELVGKC